MLRTQRRAGLQDGRAWVLEGLCGAAPAITHWPRTQGVNDERTPLTSVSELRGYLLQQLPFPDRYTLHPQAQPQPLPPSVPLTELGFLAASFTSSCR